ncbi:MAG: hypothetical protein LBP96_04960, partial [Bacteroidales bacterium]|nr:hypothetical protein [Bacteroidales bacterium]
MKHKILILSAILATSVNVFAQTRTEVLAAMKKATTAIDQKYGNNGAYVWHYLPDNSRRWGEAEAFITMGWVETYGTPAMGNIFLDLYHATNDEFYYNLAVKSAKSLIAAQTKHGGWNHHYDVESPANQERWYNTIGKQAWRMEEMMHYYGPDNSTFDDYVHGDAAEFLLRM